MDAIIDNSTLSAVERLLGISLVRNLNNIDHDIVCFEKLITAILFNEKLHLVDDYKPQYSERRKEIFSFINVLNISETDYSVASSSAAKFAQELTFGLKGSELVGDVVSFFEQLVLKPQMRWDIFTSSEYLTLTYLVANDETKWQIAQRIAAFGNEYTDAQRNSKHQGSEISLADSKFGDGLESVAKYVERKRASNPDSKGTGHQNTLHNIVFGYGWAGERTKFYEEIAQQRSMNVVLSPLRDAFSIAALGIDNLSNIERLIDNASLDILESLVEYHKVTDGAATTFAIPFFTSWIMSQNEVRNARDAISFVLELRDRENIRTIRDFFDEIQKSSGNKSDITKINRELQKVSSDLAKEYTYSGNQGPSFSISTSFFGPSVGVSSQIGELFHFPGSKSRRIFRLYRSMVSDLKNVERLGTIHDKLQANMRRHEKATYASVSTTPRFMRNKSNEYGKPAD